MTGKATHRLLVLLTIPALLAGAAPGTGPGSKPGEIHSGDAPAASASVATQTIENETLRVTYDDTAGSFAVAEKTTGRLVLTNGRLEGKAIKASVEAANDVVFGAGNKIVVTQADRGIASLELYAKLPFALIRMERHNGGKEMLDVRKAVPAAFTLDLGKPAGELRTLGTGTRIPSTRTASIGS
jgi:hypothetical protein